VVVVVTTIPVSLAEVMTDAALSSGLSYFFLAAAEIITTTLASSNLLSKKRRLIRQSPFLKHI